jgi:hypothetical protein
MAEYVLDLACGHQRLFTYWKKPPFLQPSETAWSLSWCTDCGKSQKVFNVRQRDGLVDGGGLADFVIDQPESDWEEAQ